MLLSEASKDCSRSALAGGDSPNTVSLFNWTMNHLLDYLGDVEFHEITIDDLIEFMQEMSDEYIPQRKGKDLSPLCSSSVRNMHIAIRRLFCWASQNWEKTGVTIRTDLALEMPLAVHKQIYPLKPDEIKKLTDQALIEKNQERNDKSYKRGLVVYAMIMTFLSTGVRVSELIRLSIQDFSKLNKKVIIHAYGNSRRKTKYRQIKLLDDAFAALQEYLATRPKAKPTDPLFLNEKNERWTRSAIRHTLLGLSKRAGVSRVHPHVMRYSYAAEFIRNHRGTYSELSYLLGESTFTMTDHYVKLTGEEVSTTHAMGSTVDRYNLSRWAD